jgi:hypothetical protein
LQVHTLRMRNGRQRFPKHVEQVPSWQDVLVCDLDSDLRLRAMWVSSNPDWQDVGRGGRGDRGAVARARRGPSGRREDSAGREGRAPLPALRLELLVGRPPRGAD